MNRPPQWLRVVFEGRKPLAKEDDKGVLFVPGKGLEESRLICHMRDRGILVRDRSADYGCNDCVRITVGIRDHNQRMLSALREVFAELGLRQQVAR